MIALEAQQSFPRREEEAMKVCPQELIDTDQLPGERTDSS